MKVGYFLLSALLSYSVAAKKDREPKSQLKIEGDAMDGAVDIRSDRLVVIQKKRLAIFSGNVKTVQDNLSIHCDKLEVLYAGSGGSGSGIGAIKRMVFSGSVQIMQKERRGHCGRAEYDRPAGRIVCTGEPWVVEGKNLVKGDRIEYLLRQDEVRVTHPRALIRLPKQHPDKKRKSH